MTNEEFIITQFNKVKELGWVKSRRANNTGIGKTFEDFVGVVENNLDEPDLAGYEIKSHRADAASYVTLFTKSPSFPRKANSFLKDLYGEPYEDNPNLKKLHTSIFATSYNSYLNRLSFRLLNDRNNRRIHIGVHSVDDHQLLDNSVYYTYDDIDVILKRKLHDLFYVVAERQYRDTEEYFKFNKAEIYSQPSLSRFLDLIDTGIIMYDIRIGSYSSGRNIGKAHDHGSGFRIKENDICKLYESKKVVE
ncbi:MAG: MvaI/BcnI family restriction endonuclease [Bacteroidales bacterium]